MLFYHFLSGLNQKIQCKGYLTFVFAVSCVFQSIQAQQTWGTCHKIEKIQVLINSKHVQPVSIEAQQRKEIVVLYIDELDAFNLFFTTEKVETLKEIAASEGLCASFEKSREMYLKAIDRYDSLCTAFLMRPFSEKKGETLTRNISLSKHLRVSENVYSDFIHKILKYRILNASINKIEADSTLPKTYTADLDKKIREEIATEEKDFVKRKKSGKTEQQLLNIFLNAIALRYDPHSNYFSIDEKSDLEKELSDNVLIFGIQYYENQQFEIEITGLTPGSSAWISDQVDEGDIIEEIEFRRGEKVSLKNKGTAYISEVLRDKALTELVFYLRKKTGLTTKVKLEKTRIVNKENSFTGYVLSDQKTKLGYISLPSFYTDFESDNRLGCANDVAKEIILLKKDSIQGLIIDLRNNGGGSLWEALELTGLFIDEGPLSVYQAANSKPSLLKDPKRGTVYDGPVVILINNTSASASEFFAGCMQDYQRALVFGDQSYGKGSAQSIFPLDSTDYLGKNGYAKITNGKFYHVSGRSNQETGIVPDVYAQDIQSQITYYKESKQAYHIVNDSTRKKVVYTKSEIVFPSPITAQSKQRISESADFKLLESKAALLQSRVENDVEVPLEFDKFTAYKKADQVFWDEIYNFKELTSDFTISNHSYAQKLLSFQGNERKQNDEIKTEMKKDVFIFESCLIFRDFFNFEK